MTLRRWTRNTMWQWGVPSLLVLGVSAAGGQAVQPSFEVATVKPAGAADPNTGSWSPPNIGRFTATHVTLRLLMQLAYGVDKSQVVNQPSWLDTSCYDVVAKPEEGVRLSREELKPRLQTLLRQRFHLVTHLETRSGHGYALVVAKGGPHLAPTKGDHFAGFRLDVSPGQMRGLNWSMPILAKYLTGAAEFPVVDQTGLAGSYDIEFSYEPNPDADSGRPPLGLALTQATGLLLKPQNVPVEVVVIDSVDRVPTEN